MPYGGSGVADALRGVGQMFGAYSEGKERQRMLAIEEEERKARSNFRRLQADRLRADMDKFRMGSAQQDAINTGEAALEEAKLQKGDIGAILKNLPEVKLPGADETFQPQVGPGPSVEQLLQPKMDETVTIPGSEVMGIQPRQVSPVRLAMQKYRAERQAMEAENPPVALPFDERIPEQFRGQVFRYGHPLYEIASKMGGEYAKAAFEKPESADLGPPPTRVIGGRVMGWNELTQNFDIDFGQSGKTKGGVGDVKPTAASENPYLAPVAETLDWSLRGDAFLKQLPPELQGAARAASNYKAKLGRGTGDTKFRTALSIVMPYINPNWSMQGYEFALDWAKGNMRKGRQAVNNVLADVGKVFDLSEKFERTDFPWINKGIGWFYEKTGRPEERALRTALTNVATEFALAQKNGMAPIQREIEEVYDRYTTAASPEQLRGMLEADIEFAANRLATHEGDWRRITGQENPPAPTIDRRTVQQAKKYGYFDAIEAAGLYLGEDQKPMAGATPGEGEECPPAPDGSPCGKEKIQGGRITRWDGQGWEVLGPAEAVAPGTGPLKRTEQPFSLQSILGQ